MTNFAIVTPAKNEALDQRLKEIYEEQDVLFVDDNLRIVSSDKEVTAESLYIKLEHSKDKYGRVIVFSVSSYYGFHAKSVWEWLTSRSS